MRLHRWGAIELSVLFGLAATVAAHDAQRAVSTGPALANSARLGPQVTRPYPSPPVPDTSLANSARLQSLVGGGKIELSVDDAMALALENNLDVVAASYEPAFAAADLLRAKAGGATLGVAGAFRPSSLFSGALGGAAGGSTGPFDPAVNFNFGWNQSTAPLGITILQGVPVVSTHTVTYTYSINQAFATGATFGLSLSGSRQSTTGVTSLFNPQIPTQLTFGLTQPLLNGFGRRVNARFIRIARNNIRFADSSFRQKVMTTVAQVVSLYWDVVSARQHVEVARKALDLAEKTRSDITKEVQLGVIARFEMVREGAKVSRQRGVLVRAQAEYKQNAERLKTALAKHVDPDLATAEIIPSSHLPEPGPEDIPELAQALREALANRPEIEQADLNLRNQEITIKAIHSATLPSLNVFATYAPQGLSGNRILRDTSGTVVSIEPGGFGQSVSQTLQNQYPSYSAGVSLSIPLRNRAAHADLARSLLEQRQLGAILQQQKNAVEEDVRRALIALSEAKAGIEAAHDAAVTAQQTLDGEQKKFQLGESDVFRIVLAQRDVFSAKDSEVAARADYAKALVHAEQATGTILARHHIEIDDAQPKGR